MSPIARSFALGIACGLRSMTPPALLGWSARSGRITLPTVFRWARAPRASNMILACALMEMVVDKQPFTPRRTGPPELALRIVNGIASGAASPARNTWTRIAGAAAGAVGAIVGSYAGENARAWIGKRTGLPDPLVASLEDVVTVAVALQALER